MPLVIKVPQRELYDNITGEFSYLPSATLELEHSLLSISKWESKWKKAFLNVEKLEGEEFIDYIRCMTLKPVSPEIYLRLTNKNLATVNAYIEDPMSATTFRDKRTNKPVNKKKKVTSEEIYSWLVGLQIPWEVQKWNFNRLMNLVRICEINNDPKSNTMSMKDTYADYKAINAANRARMKRH